MEEHALRRMTQCKGSETMTWKGLVALVVVMGAMAGAWPGSANAGVQKLYVLDCGQNIGKDQSRWSPGVNEGKAIEFSDNCYLIRHDKGLLLWDTGVPRRSRRSSSSSESSPPASPTWPCHIRTAITSATSRSSPRPRC